MSRLGRFWIGGTIGAVMLGCAVVAPGTAPSAAPSSTPLPLSSSLPDVNGTWTFGEGATPEPPPGAGSCQTYLGLAQEGDRLTLTSHRYCGLPSDEVSGTFTGRHVHLEGLRYRGRLAMPSVWELDYHPETGHFTGTDNGQAVWIAPTSRCMPSTSITCWMTVDGTLYDQSSNLLYDKARVTARTLDPTYPFDSTVEVSNGHYVFNGVPIATELEITVQVEGQPAVTRRETLQRGPVWTVNFGGPVDPIDPEGWRYWAKAVPSPPPPSGPTAAPSGF